MAPDSDPDPAIFVIDLQDANKKLILKKSLSAYYFLKVQHLHHFSRIKRPKEVTKQQESRFFLLFLLDNRRARTGFGAGSGSIPLTHGSGSGRPKNMWW
jgi:hypothetical protein